jgi:hypothetical protein
MNKKIHVALAIVSLCAVGGCVRDTEVTRQVTRVGKNWEEVESTQRYRTEGGRVVREKQRIKEKITCVNKKGQRLPAETAEECLQKKGIVVDEVDTLETRTVR